jgi:hypothetical protein
MAVEHQPRYVQASESSSVSSLTEDVPYAPMTTAAAPSTEPSGVPGTPLCKLTHLCWSVSREITVRPVCWMSKVRDVSVAHASYTELSTNVPSLLLKCNVPGWVFDKGTIALLLPVLLIALACLHGPCSAIMPIAPHGSTSPGP